MNLEALNKLTRSELQKLAKSMGVRAVGKTAYIIQRLCKVQAARGNNAESFEETESGRKTDTSGSATAVNTLRDGNSEAATEPVSESHEENKRRIPAAGISRQVSTPSRAMPKRRRQTVQSSSRRTNTASPASRAQSEQEASEQSNGTTTAGKRTIPPATNRAVRPAIVSFGHFMEDGAASQEEVTHDGQHNIDIPVGGSISGPVSSSASEVRHEAAERLPASVRRPGEHVPPDVQGAGQAYTAPRSRTSSPTTDRAAFPPTSSTFMGDRVAGTDTARREHSEMVAGPSGNHRGPSTGSTTHLAAAEQSAASVMGTEKQMEQVSSILSRRAAPNGGSSAAAFQPVWTPIVVGEREGEPGYSQSAARENPWRQGQRRGSRETTLSATSRATSPSHIQRPQNVPRMCDEDENEDSDSSKPGRAPPAYLRAFAPSPNANHAETFDEQAENEDGRPTRRELRDELWQISERAREYPKIQMEIHQLHGVMNVIRTKEAWMEARMQEIQRLRLAMQKQYVMKLKSNPALLGRTYRDPTHEEELFLGAEVQEDAVQSVEDIPRDDLAPLAPSPRKEERMAEESELAMVKNVPRKASL